MVALGLQSIWPDEAGTATDPDTTFATVGNGPVYDVGTERELVLDATVTGSFVRAIEIMVEIQLNSGSWYPWVIKAAQGTNVATDHIGFKTTLPNNTRFRVSARRFGGNANTRLVIDGWLREAMGELSYYGQPVELVNHQLVGIECWGSGAGAHDHPAAGPNYAPAPAAAADQLRIPTGEADTLVIRYAVAALAATTIEFVVQESIDDGTTFRPLQAVNSVVAGVVSQTLAQESCTGAIGTFISREISVRPGTLIRVDAQRTGGGANTELLAYAHLYRLGR